MKDLHHVENLKNQSIRIAHKGYDVFYTEPSVSETMECRVCGTLCDVKRNATGPTGHLSAMSGNQTLHDSFRCPNIGKDCHNEATKLAMAIDRTPSKSIAAVMNKDLQILILSAHLDFYVY